MGVSTISVPGMPIPMYRISTVYVPYINRISTVVDSEGVAEGKEIARGASCR